MRTTFTSALGRVALCGVSVAILLAVTPAWSQDRAAATEPQIRTIIGNDTVLAPPKSYVLPSGGRTSYKFEDAPVAEFATLVLRDVIKADYVLHPPINGSVTLSTGAEVTPDQALLLLEGVLQANGLVMARDTRGTYHIGKPEALRTIVPGVRQALPGATLPPGTGAIVVKLNYIGASEMAAILRPLASPEAIVRVDNVRNLLVLAGNRTQAEGWLDLVSTFDVDLLKGMSVGVFPLKYVSAKDVEAALAVLGGGGAPAPSGASSPGATPGRPGTGAAGAQAGAQAADAGMLTGAFRVLPIDRLNSILVVTPRAAYLEEARRWIEKLDQPGGGGSEPQLFIYQVQNVNARHLASVLGGIFGDARQQGTPQPGASGVAPGLFSATGSSMGQAVPTNPFGSTANRSTLGTSGIGASTLGAGGSSFGAARTVGAAGAGQQNSQGQSPAVASLGGIRIMADELNNSVLVWSTRSEYEKIEATLKRLDLPLTQVLIEASIVEVTLTDDLNYGLQWAFNDSRSGTDYTGRGVLSSGGGGVLGGALAGFSYTLKNPAGEIRAVLNALSKKTSVKVLASPSLMVLDNHTASIAVGTQTPINAGESITSDAIIRTSIQYKDTGVNLIVTPSVNSGNVVTMQVDQSVTDLGSPGTATTQPTFLQRQLSSKLAVRSGESIVMGGLIQSNSSTAKSGIPVLHKLPLLGSLFGSTVDTGVRTELLVVITPRVVRSDIDIREVSDDLRDRMRGLAAHERTPASAAPR